MTTATLGFVICACLLSAVRAQFGNVDPTPYLQNRAFVQQQLRCVVGTGGCDFVGQFLQRAVTEVVGRNCARCTPQQAANARRLLEYIRTNYPTEEQTQPNHQHHNIVKSSVYNINPVLQGCDGSGWSELR
ncbi:hypothetical protein J6590_002741 [Homalodisca vitripennis]|nr:hypothetical protein J6590_002741 [Homalodisca vitripennis]